MAVSDVTSLRDIHFGLSAAEKEGAEHPELLIDGFFDLDGTAAELMSGSRFLVLGYKGSGKSAISQHLKLRSADDSSLCVHLVSLAQFPYAMFSSRFGPEERLADAWTLLLLVDLFDSFSRDQSSPARSNDEFTSAFDCLRELALLPTHGPARAVNLLTSTNKFSGSQPNGAPDGDSQELPRLVDRLVDLATTFESATQHLFVIDGLDEMPPGGAAQYGALAALMSAVNSINLRCAAWKCRAKFIVLCRTDLFERLPGPNKNKIRQDSAVYLDWYHRPRRLYMQKLVQLVNQKASVTDPNVGDVFERFFPSHIGERQTISFLLDHTRHTPRDFLRLITHIKELDSGAALTESQVQDGARSYAINYFVPEMKDELVGYADVDEVDGLLALLASFRQNVFSLKVLREHARRSGQFRALDLPRLLDLLFECSAIGLLRPDANRDSHAYFTFKYRDRYARLNLDEQMIVHRALSKGLNFRYRQAS